jgi:hypothetical protein
MRRSIGLVLAILAAPLPVKSAEPVVATYAFRWAGLEVARLELDVRVDGKDYRARWEGSTTGLAGGLFPFVSSGEVEGRIDGAELRPQRYRGRSAWSDGASSWRVAFDPDGRATEILIERDDLGAREPVPPRLQVGPDPMTLALAALARVGPGARLEGRSFDGRRALRYELACGDPPGV